MRAVTVCFSLSQRLLKPTQQFQGCMKIYEGNDGNTERKITADSVGINAVFCDECSDGLLVIK